MANVFNSVKGLTPKMRSYSAHSYRNDLTHPAGVVIPVYQQHLTAKTRVLLRAHALVRTQPLVAPIMDNVDYFVHFWQIPYRLLENDKFTEFISGELEDQSEYNGNGWFFAPKSLAQAYDDIYADYTTREFYSIFGDGGLFDLLGYDASLFGYQRGTNSWDLSKASEMVINWRPLIAYIMLMLHWYMNENVPFYSSFIEDAKDLLKNGVLDPNAESEYRGLKSSFLDFFNEINLLNQKGASETDSKYCSFFPHGWHKDYFTSALPNVQAGAAAGISLNIGGSATIAPFNAYLKGTGEGVYPGKEDAIHGVIANPELTEHAAVNYLGLLGTDPTTASSIDRPIGESYNFNSLSAIKDVQIYNSDGTGDIESTVTLDEPAVILINELRFANALQVFKERQLRFGRRRLEYYKGFFDVTPEDLRLQVPRFLGGGRVPINISDVEQTSETTASSAQGNLAGKGTAVAGGFAGFNTFASEETLIIGLAFVMPKNTYANCLSRFLTKTNNVYDYFNPSFQHLGEQAVYNYELYAGDANPLGEFGYSPRYNEYRFHANEVHGSFKNTLSYWNLSRNFSKAPALNPDFIYMKPHFFDRIFAYAGADPILASLHFSVRILQPVSKYGTPMLLA